MLTASVKLAEVRPEQYRLAYAWLRKIDADGGVNYTPPGNSSGIERVHKLRPNAGDARCSGQSFLHWAHCRWLCR